MVGFFPFSFPYFPHWTFHKFPYNSSYFPLPFSTFNFQLLFRNFYNTFSFYTRYLSVFSPYFSNFPVYLSFISYTSPFYPKSFPYFPPYCFSYFPLFFLVFSPNNYRIIPAEYLMAWLYYIVQYIVLYIYSTATSLRTGLLPDPIKKSPCSGVLVAESL